MPGNIALAVRSFNDEVRKNYKETLTDAEEKKYYVLPGEASKTQILDRRTGKIRDVTISYADGSYTTTVTREYTNKEEYEAQKYYKKIVNPGS